MHIHPETSCIHGKKLICMGFLGGSCSVRGVLSRFVHRIENACGFLGFQFSGLADLGSRFCLVSSVSDDHFSGGSPIQTQPPD